MFKSFKFVLAAVIGGLTMGGCKEDQGVKKGQFEQACENGGGILTRISPNEYECKLPDGTVLKSQEKK